MNRRALIAFLALCGAGSCTALSAASAARQAATLRVVTYNIRHGRGMDDRVDIERTAAVLRALGPDIVGLQEVDSGTQRSGRIDEARELGRQLGLHHAFGSFFDYQGGQYGMAILSRYPVQRTYVVRLPDGNEPRVALAVEVRPPGQSALLVINVHFDWVDDDRFRFAQASVLATVLDTLSLPWILLGDFNDVPDSRTLTLFRRRALEAAKPAEDRFTFSSADPRKEIDFIFASPRTYWAVDSVRVIDEPVASDHRPVLTVLRHAPSTPRDAAAVAWSATTGSRPARSAVLGARARAGAW